MVRHQQSISHSWLIWSLICIALLTACTSSPSSPTNTEPMSNSTHSSQETTGQNCLAGPTPKLVNSAFGPAIGQSPLWAAGFDGPHATLHLAGSSHTQNGWMVKVLWLLEPNLTHPITIQGSDETSASRHLVFDLTGQITSTALLDPGGTPHNQWSNFASYVFVPAVGCYVLKATWAGNTWQIPFTAAL